MHSEKPICPGCKSALVIGEASGVTTQRCATCSGIWVDSKALDILRRMEQRDSDTSQIVVSRTSSAKDSERVCPICPSVQLRETFLRGVEIDVCPSCAGVYFDVDELQQVLPKKHRPMNTERDSDVGAAVLLEGGIQVLFGLLSG